VKAFDSFIEPPELVQSTGRESEKQRMVASLEAVAPGRELREAIDEVLRAQPSSVPPALFDKKDAPPSPRQVGDLPRAPPPLTTTLPLGVRSKSGELPQVVAPPVKTRSAEYPAVPTPPRPRMKSTSNEITLSAPSPADAGMRSSSHSLTPELRVSNIQASIADALAKSGIDDSLETTRPDDIATEPPADLPPVPEPPNLFPALDQTLAMERPMTVPKPMPDEVPTVVPPKMADEPPPPAIVQTATSPMHIVAPMAHAPPAHGIPPSGPPMRSPMGSVPSAPGTAHSTPSDISGPSSTLPRRKSSAGVGIVAFVLVLLVAVGVAGTVGYVRWQKSAARPVPTPTPTPAPTPTPTTSAVVTASVSVASSNAPPIPSASAAGEADASATAPPSGSSDVPEGMGLLKTTGTAPHRRIFVDDKVVGQTPETATVKCGSHLVRLGSAGKAQTIEVPCGGEVTVVDVPLPGPKPAPSN
jgi:hypothetical protein